MTSAAEYSILAIDDTDIILDILKVQLEPEGYKVTTARNGSSAKNLIQLTKYDLILLDIEMPDINGVDLLKFIKQQGDNIETPVIMLTADNDPEKVNACMSNGSKDYVLKPINFESLKKRISRILKID
jgi:DNA-binding response OmpR family regulator